MSRDPDLERDLEQLMSRVDLPERERWVPTDEQPRVVRSNAITAGAIAAAVLFAVLIGVVGLPGVAAPDASRRPIQTLPTLVRPTPAAAATASPPRGTAVVAPAGTILDFREDAGSAAADDHALAAVVSPQASPRIVVTETGGQSHTIAATRGRMPFLSAHGALRGDLVAYTEIEAIDASASAPLVVWHVMVANWRTGAITELDAFPGEQSIAPHAPDYMPNAYTNGRDVIWLRTPRVKGELGETNLVLWRGGRTTIIWRTDWRSELSYALADDGRIAVVSLACPPRDQGGFCPTGTRWELYVLDGSLTPKLVTWRNAFGDRRGVGGPPAFAGGNNIVWAQVSGAPLNVTYADIVDVATGDTRTVGDPACAWIGATVREVVFTCQDATLRVYPVAGAITKIESNEAGTFYFFADPHAIFGRRADGAWVIRPVPD
jgi:hypothetical protein